jgi:hypothetical protein
MRHFDRQSSTKILTFCGSGLLLWTSDGLRQWSFERGLNSCSIPRSSQYLIICFRRTHLQDAGQTLFFFWINHVDKCTRYFPRCYVNRGKVTSWRILVTPPAAPSIIKQFPYCILYLVRQLRNRCSFYKSNQDTNNWIYFLHECFSLLLGCTSSQRSIL